MICRCGFIGPTWLQSYYIHLLSSFTSRVILSNAKDLVYTQAILGTQAVSSELLHNMVDRNTIMLVESLVHKALLHSPEL